MQFHSARCERRWHGRVGHIARLGAVLLLLTSASAARAATLDRLPTTEDELVTMVRTAIVEHDLDTFTRLVNWNGAGAMKRRLTNIQLLRGLGRPIRSVEFEPFPANGLDEAAGLQLEANMPVSHRLRVTYDEPAIEGSERSPASVYLVGKDGDAYRIALVVRKSGAKPD